MNAIPNPQRLVLDEEALRAAAHDLDAGAVTPSYGPWRDDILKLLNDALATELVCVLRYKRHYYTAQGLASPQIAAEFLEHAHEESAHADRLAERIVQLGGEPDFAPDGLSARSHSGLSRYFASRSAGSTNSRIRRSCQTAFAPSASATRPRLVREFISTRLTSSSAWA